MTPFFDNPWSHSDPGPELLAAYLDGELEGRDDLAALKIRLEDWITSHPQVRAQIQQHRRLRQIWAQTTPVEPSTRQWRGMLEDILVQAKQSPDPKTPAKGVRPSKNLNTLWTWAVVAIVAFLLAIPVYDWLRTPTEQEGATARANVNLPEDEEPLPVARSAEVVVLQVAGSDTASLPIGQLPVHGELELARSSDIAIASPTRVVQGHRFPMVWARLEDNEP